LHLLVPLQKQSHPLLPQASYHNKASQSHDKPHLAYQTSFYHLHNSSTNEISKVTQFFFNIPNSFFKKKTDYKVRVVGGIQMH
jgi:hypothetical protein